MKKILLISLLMVMGFGLTIPVKGNNTLKSSPLISQTTKKKPTSSSVNFNSPASVMAWLSGKTFENEGTKIKFDYDSVYLNGSAVTGAPIIKDFTTTTAVIVAYSPYMGGSGMTFYVDALKGTVRQAGDTFYLKK